MKAEKRDPDISYCVLHGMSTYKASHEGSKLGKCERFGGCFNCPHEWLPRETAEEREKRVAEQKQREEKN